MARSASSMTPVTSARTSSSKLEKWRALPVRKLRKSHCGMKATYRNGSGSFLKSANVTDPSGISIVT